MNGMSLLFAGLVALGVAIIIVVLLKCLCFVGEFLIDKRRSSHHQSSSQSPTETILLSSEPSTTSALLHQERSFAGVEQATASHRQQQGYSVRRLSDRIYVICVEPNSNGAIDPKLNLILEQDPEDLPPTYEQAVQSTIQSTPAAAAAAVAILPSFTHHNPLI